MLRKMDLLPLKKVLKQTSKNTVAWKERKTFLFLGFKYLSSEIKYVSNECVFLVDDRDISESSSDCLKINKIRVILLIFF